MAEQSKAAGDRATLEMLHGLLTVPSAVWVLRGGARGSQPNPPRRFFYA